MEKHFLKCKLRRQKCHGFLNNIFPLKIFSFQPFQGFLFYQFPFWSMLIKFFSKDCNYDGCSPNIQILKNKQGLISNKISGGNSIMHAIKAYLIRIKSKKHCRTLFNEIIFNVQTNDKINRFDLISILHTLTTAASLIFWSPVFRIPHKPSSSVHDPSNFCFSINGTIFDEGCPGRKKRIWCWF